MAVVYLEPRDLTATQAGEVLRYLNRATSAAEIASRIEFAGEPDIGPKLAERLLRARAALGGEFRTLEQVAAVPLIGPERFTEICVGLLGLNPAASLAGLLDAQRAALAERITRLEASGKLTGPGAGVTVTVEVSPREAWLGQALDVTIRVVDATGAGVSGRNLTVEASNGNLESSFGLTVQRRRALNLGSGVDGSVHLRLHGPVVEPLSLAQEAALDEALSKLDPAQTSPHLLAAGFQALAERYSSEREHVLRRAIDVYARQYKVAFLDRLNAGNLGFEWPLESSVVRVDCHPERGGSQALAQAVVVVEWKNWVGAWFGFLRDYLAERAKLEHAFSAAKSSGAKGYQLVDALLGDAHGFVAEQRGLAAEWTSQRVVKDAVTRFLGTELEGVDEATRSELFANLEAAAEQLTPAHRGAIAMVTQTRRDLDDRILATDLSFAALNTQLVNVQTQVKNELTAELGAVRQQLESITAELGNVRKDVGVVRGNIGRVETDLGRIRTDVARVEGDVGKVKLDVDALRPGGGRG